jgi:hypothetical protein
VKRLIAVAVVVTGLGLAAGCSGSAKAGAPARLAGLFKLSAGHCTSARAKPAGSYLVVVSAANARAVRNPRGGCANSEYTPLSPGTDGGLETGRFQEQPAPTFDARRNSTATRLITPVAFGHYRLGFATSPRDEQGAPTGAPTYPAPVALNTAGALTVDLRSLVMTYAGRANSTCAQSFGLGCWDLGSKSATGTYNPTTHHFLIDWFTGESFTPKGDSIEVHLEGTFVPGATS